MCAIIDACVATQVFLEKEENDFTKIRELLIKRKLQIVYGGDLAREYTKILKVLRVIKAFDQAGIAKKISDSDVDDENQAIVRLGLCKSNDTHVIALARVSKARLLCSADNLLHTDFKNKQLIDKPRGRIYQNSRHDNLLRRKCKQCNKIG